MTRAEFNKLNNEVNNTLDYNLDDIRFELQQICSVFDIVTNAAFEACFPITAETDKICNSLYLLRSTLFKTYSRLEVLIGFSEPLPTDKSNRS